MISLNIQKISLSKLDEVVNIHSIALPDDVLTNLGKTLLSRYYKSAIEDHSQLIIGCSSDGNLLGYCLISKRDLGLMRLFFSFHGLSTLLALMLSRPHLFYSGLKQAIRITQLKANTAEISFIAVLPEYQGIGIGKAMIDYAVQVCRGKKIEFLQTKTANRRLRNYYIKKHFAEEVDRYDVCGKVYSVLKWSTLLIDSR
jgi:ribosomal protein S18 acetylase RimI-like enzyme